MADRDDELARLRERAVVLEREVREARSTEELLRSVLENAPDIISRVAIDGTLLYLNRVVSGTVLEEVLGRSALDFVAPESRSLVQRTLDEVARTGAPGVYDCKALGPDGAMSEYSTTVSPIKEGDRVVALTLIARDVSTQRATERALRESDEKLRLAIGATGVGLWSWDFKTGAISWDDALCRIFGVDRAPADYDAFLALMHPDDREMVSAHVKRSAETGVYPPLEHRIVRPDGEARWLFGTATIVRDELGQLALLIGGTFDVTDRRRVDEQLRLAQKMEAVGQLSAGIAHNFNNMLAVIVPSVEAAAVSAIPAASEMLAAARDAALRAAGIVRELVLFAGRSRATERKPLAIEALVERTVRMCQSTFDSRITIDLRLAPEPPLIVADGGQIEQALLNVLINARDAVQTSPEPRPRTIRVRVEAADGVVLVRVEDNGVGMDAATRRRVFEPFFTTKEVGRGTGLGLATTYAIVEDHGGSVECASTVGVGTTFTLTFPAAPETDRRHERPGAAPGVAGGSERVLVADDEALVRSTVARTLRGAGYDVVEAEDGEAALRALTAVENRIDLVLLDESMPKLSGRGVLAAMRERGIGVPVIGWTAHVGAMEGVQAVLNKPATSAALLRAVRGVLDA
jgi:two-component system cell cycle sensor histidine kinase/response regulator CckA